MHHFEQQTYYELLEISVTASRAEIASAYTRALETYSPDSIAVYTLVDPDQLESLHQRLAQARQVLGDVERRLEYDRSIGVKHSPEDVARLRADPPPGEPAAEAKPPEPVPVAVETRPAEPAPVIAETKPSAPPPATGEVTPAEPGPTTGEVKPAEPMPVAAPAVEPAPVAVETRPAEPAPVAEAPPAPGEPAEPVSGEPAPAPAAEPPPSALVPVGSGKPGVHARPSAPVARPGALQSPGRPLGKSASAPSSPEPATPTSALATSGTAGTSAPVRDSRSRLKAVDIPEDAEFNGELLRRVREGRGMTLQTLAERTRISSKHMDNIEADRYSALPAAVYLRGMLMSLARELGLDPLRVSRSYMALVAAAEKKRR